LEPLHLAMEQVLRSSPKRLDMVLESAWMPLVTVRTGPLWRPEDVEALLRSRLADKYKGIGSTPAEWAVRTSHRAGDAIAVGFGLPTGVRRVLDDLGSGPGRGKRWRRVLPAWGFGRRRHMPWRARRGLTWLAWPEQDRWITSLEQSGRIRYLNPCVDAPGSDDGLRRLLARECLRAGLAAEERADAVWLPGSSATAEASSFGAWRSMPLGGSVPA
jgi:hypothetical protein